MLYYTLKNKTTYISKDKKFVQITLFNSLQPVVIMVKKRQKKLTFTNHYKKRTQLQTEI